MPTQYRRIEIRTVEGLRKAERLYRLGWKQLQVGLFSILFEKRIPPKALVSIRKGK